MMQEKKGSRDRVKVDPGDDLHAKRALPNLSTFNSRTYPTTLVHCL
jgi:hypothetical protein